MCVHGCFSFVFLSFFLARLYFNSGQLSKNTFGNSVSRVPVISHMKKIQKLFHGSDSENCKSSEARYMA